MKFVVFLFSVQSAFISFRISEDEEAEYRVETAQVSCLILSIVCYDL